MEGRRRVMVSGGSDERVSNKKYLKNYKNIFSKETIFTSRRPLAFRRQKIKDFVQCRI